jgi:hypothetical protein
MTGMGRPKHYVPMGKWFWIILLGVMLVGFASVDLLPPQDSFLSRWEPVFSLPESMHEKPRSAVPGNQMRNV